MVFGKHSKEGSSHGVFCYPAGIDKDRIYITEFENARVQCLDLNLKFNSFIDNVLGARDVKLTSDEIVVLSSRNPCVSLYTYSHQLIREMIPRGEGNPSFLILDKSLNILITDFESHRFSVFSFGVELIHRFGKMERKEENY